VPLAGKVRLLSPALSVNGPLLPLSHMKLSLPPVGVNAQAAKAVWALPAQSSKEKAQTE